MDSKLRYILIAIGFAVFIILSPLAVLYVRGLKPDINQGKTKETGIFTSKTDPSGAVVFLNSDEKGKTPLDVRFLASGDIHVDIKKQGYRTWSKRLAIIPGRVTWAQSGVDTLFLFKEDSGFTKIDDGVDDFIQTTDSYIYTQTDKLVVTDTGDIKDKKYFNITKGTPYLIKGSPNNKTFLIYNTENAYLFRPSNSKLEEISKITKKSSLLKFTDSGSLYTIEGNKLVFRENSFSSPVTLATNLSTFELLDDDIYGISATDNKLYFFGKAGNLTKQELAELPELENPNLIITPSKAIYILENKNFYHLGNSLEKISSNVERIVHPYGSELITIIIPGELDTYRSGQKQPQTINRSTDGYDDAVVREDIGYAFIVSNKTLKAIELDQRDSPNIYDFKDLNEPIKIHIDQDTENLTVLDNKELKVTVIH